MMKEFAETFRKLKELLSESSLTGDDLRALVALNRHLIALWHELTGPSR